MPARVLKTDPDPLDDLKSVSEWERTLFGPSFGIKKKKIPVAEPAALLARPVFFNDKAELLKRMKAGK